VCVCVCVCVVCVVCVVRRRRRRHTSDVTSVCVCVRVCFAASYVTCRLQFCEGAQCAHALHARGALALRAAPPPRLATFADRRHSPVVLPPRTRASHHACSTRAARAWCRYISPIFSFRALFILVMHCGTSVVTNSRKTTTTNARTSPHTCRHNAPFSEPQLLHDGCVRRRLRRDAVALRSS
jgi:hypothetical protein